MEFSNSSKQQVSTLAGTILIVLLILFGISGQFSQVAGNSANGGGSGSGSPLALVSNRNIVQQQQQQRPQEAPVQVIEPVSGEFAELEQLQQTNNDKPQKMAEGFLKKIVMASANDEQQAPTTNYAAGLIRNGLSLAIPSPMIRQQRSTASAYGNNYNQQPQWFEDDHVLRHQLTDLIAQAHNDKTLERALLRMLINASMRSSMNSNVATQPLMQVVGGGVYGGNQNYNAAAVARSGGNLFGGTNSRDNGGWQQQQQQQQRDNNNMMMMNSVEGSGSGYNAAAAAAAASDGQQQVVPNSYPIMSRSGFSSSSSSSSSPMVRFGDSIDSTVGDDFGISGGVSNQQAQPQPLSYQQQQQQIDLSPSYSPSPMDKREYIKPCSFNAVSCAKNPFRKFN